ncbi:OLC1v1030854C2 [Oldenlandia corymbosa var. corymbosa]|uniref:OLC1v1030854C2 n=1 Tax=Oldenlandia corymbosa var. corymbosa TaxID=529605 RepID=A0AAV1CK18_OLDCO|nr:OLC1v1030854C2 [Oldenlandia corymbosa var. corymbosa]
MEHLCRTSPKISPTVPSKFPLSIRHFPTFNSFSVNGPAVSFPVFLTSKSNYIPRALVSPHCKMNHHHRLRKKTNSFVLESLRLNSKFRVRAIGENSQGPSSSSSTGDNNNAKVVIFSSLVTLVLAVANRVLYKLALVPMKEYPFFLAQLTTFGYVAIYFFILYTRFKVGIVTNEMLTFPKTRFMIIGFLEALGVVAGMSSGAMLPGPAIPVLNQTFLVWQLALSVLLLGRSYSLNKIVGCLLVAAGVIFAVMSGSDNGQMLTGTGLFWPALMVVSCAFQAGASIVKESVFLDAVGYLKERSLDIFVVNSFGSGFQAFFVVLLLPFLSSLKGIPFSQLPSYLRSGAGCFLNAGTNVTGVFQVWPVK